MSSRTPPLYPNLGVERCRSIRHSGRTEPFFPRLEWNSAVLVEYWVEQCRSIRHLVRPAPGRTEPFYPRLEWNSAGLVEYWVERYRSIPHLVRPAPFYRVHDVGDPCGTPSWKKGKKASESRESPKSLRLPARQGGSVRIATGTRERGIPGRGYSRNLTRYCGTGR